jgi:hypothetical protein
MTKQKEAFAAKLAARKRKAKSIKLSAAPPSGETLLAGSWDMCPTTKPIMEEAEIDNELSSDNPFKKFVEINENSMDQVIPGMNYRTRSSMNPEFEKRRSCILPETLSFGRDADVSSSHNRSTTTTGAGLANKIGQSMTRIV